MSHTTSLYLAQIDAHVFAAQAISLHMSKVATGPLNKLITAYANAIGSPSEFIFFPLLSIAAHFTGPSTRVMINKDWLEPLILWNVVLADKGQKKSPALNRFVKPIQQLEVDLNDADDAGNDDDDENYSRQIYIEHFSMKELHYTLKRNDGRVVGLYDEISLLYEQLDKYKSGNSDRNTFLSLINGSPWRRNFRTSHSIVPCTHFNIAGFVQPDVIVNLLHSNDYDGFCDRQLFVCPPEQDVDYDIIQPPEGTPDLKDLFRAIDLNHSSSNHNYTFSNNAHEEFVSFHDQLNERKRSQHRCYKDRKSVLSKAKGQVARLATVLFALDQASASVIQESHDQPSWFFEIPCEFMERAIHLIEFCIAQKFALGKPAFKPPPANTTNTGNCQPQEIDEHRVKRLLELPSPILLLLLLLLYYYY